MLSTSIIVTPTLYGQKYVDTDVLAGPPSARYNITAILPELILF